MSKNIILDFLPKILMIYYKLLHSIYALSVIELHLEKTRIME